MSKGTNYSSKEHNYSKKNNTSYSEDPQIKQTVESWELKNSEYRTVPPECKAIIKKTVLNTYLNSIPEKKPTDDSMINLVNLECVHSKLTIADIEFIKLLDEIITLKIYASDRIKIISICDTIKENNGTISKLTIVKLKKIINILDYMYLKYADIKEDFSLLELLGKDSKGWHDHLEEIKILPKIKSILNKCIEIIEQYLEVDNIVH